MTQQIKKTHRWAEQVRQGQGAFVSSSSQPVFFFDGGFRTWAQVEHRAMLNKALAAQVHRYERN